jgi:hypothetical protein
MDTITSSLDTYMILSKNDTCVSPWQVDEIITSKKGITSNVFFKVKISHYGNDNKSIMNCKKEFLGKFTQKLRHCEEFFQKFYLLKKKTIELSVK